MSIAWASAAERHHLKWNWWRPVEQRPLPIDRLKGASGWSSETSRVSRCGSICTKNFRPSGILRTLSLREDEPYQSAMVRAGIAASDDPTNLWRSPYMPDVLVVTL